MRHGASRVPAFLVLSVPLILLAGFGRPFVSDTPAESIAFVVPAPQPSPTQAESLVDAVSSGDGGRARQLLDLGADPNERDERRWGYYADRHCPCWLVPEPQAEYRASLDGSDHPFQDELLLDRDARPRPTLLMIAAGLANVDLVRLLLSRGAQVNARDATGRTALMGAAQQQSVDALRLLLDAGAEVDVRDQNGKTALMYAVSADVGHGTGCAEPLLAHGADANARHAVGRTPLMPAAGRLNADLVHALLQAGARREAKDAAGKTARDYAETFDHGRRYSECEDDRRAHAAVVRLLKG